MTIFEKRESEVRSYCRTFDAVFAKAEGATLIDENGKCYIDFFAGAGTLNYGHNHPAMRDKLVAYLTGGGIVHSLDMYTEAKRTFLERFEEVILKPRMLDYKIMFPGPTGTNAVEAALKLARKVTGRTGVVSFTNGFHGMTLGSLAITGNAAKRAGAGLPLGHSTPLPFDGYLGEEINTIDMIRLYLEDMSSGVDKPAAFVVETVQGEGGINVASFDWLRGLADLAREHEILLIVDDIQMGCGRTGAFFSFEEAGIKPDIVTLSKSLSGFGLPFAITLFRPELDIWKPGEHNGTFRGHNPAFVTATEALNFWTDKSFSMSIRGKGDLIEKRLKRIAEKHPDLGATVRGRGMVWGIAFDDASLAGKLSQLAFEKGVVIETSGSEDQVLKFLPPLVISEGMLEEGLDLIEASLQQVVAENKKETALAGA